MDLEKLRSQIDTIDDQLTDLYLLREWIYPNKSPGAKKIVD